MKDRTEKINHFLLQEQMPDIIKVAGTDKRSSNSSSSKISSSGSSSSSATGASFPKHSVSKRIVSAVDHVTQLRLDSVRCPQLEEYLPHILDLTVVKTTPTPRHPKGWSFANPVHALHMVGSQPGGEPSSKVQRQRLPPTYMYGEEQHRTAALQTEGIAEYWCSFDGNLPDTAYEMKKQMEAALKSKPKIKPPPKTQSPTPALSTPKTASPTAATLAGAKPETLPSSDAASSEPTKDVETTDSVDQAKSGIPPISQDSTKDATGDSTDPVDPKKPENDMPSASGVAEPSIEQKDTSMELDPPTSDPIPQGIQSDGDVTSSDAATKDANGETKEADKVVSSTDTTATGPEKEVTSVDAPLPSETPPTDTTSKQTIAAEAEPTNDGSSNAQTSTDEVKEPSSAIVGKEGEDEDETTKMEIDKDESPTSSDAPAPPLPESAKEKEDTTGILPDASSSSPTALEKAAPADATTGDEKTEETESDPKDTATSDPKTPPASESTDKQEEAKDSASTENNETTEVPAAPKESTAVEGETAAKSTDTLETGQDQTPEEVKSDEKKTEVGAGSTPMKEETADPEPVDSVAEKTSSAPDVDSSEAKKDTKSQESAALDKSEPDKAEAASEAKTSDNVAMESNPTNTAVDDVVTKTIAKDDPMEVEETTRAEVKTEEVKKDASVTDATDKKPDTENTLNESKVDENEPKPVEVGSTSTTNPALPASTSKPETEVAAAPSTTNTAPLAQPQEQPQISPPPFKSDPTMDLFRREEDKIRRVRRSLMSKRVRKKPEAPVSNKEVTKKRRRSSERTSIPGSRSPLTRGLDIYEEEEYMDATHEANETVEKWMHNFRETYKSFLVGTERKNGPQKPQASFSPEFDLRIERPYCQWASKKPRRPFAGDELMVCLDCGFTACSPYSLNADTNMGMQQHLLISGHMLAVTCGEKAQIFCSEYGDFIHHEIFEQEKIRIAIERKIPYMGWKAHEVLRSFDPFQFVKTPDSGILWRGLVATYPPLVPKEHFCAAQLTLRRKALFEGSCNENWVLPKSNALYFAALQHLKTEEEKFKISAPVGIYNLGNTCFMSSILQCLIHCKPLQQYFLSESGHHHKSCEVFRHKEDALNAAAASAAAAAAAASAAASAAALAPPTKKGATKVKKPATSTAVKKKAPKVESEVCLACEMDRLFLSYYSAASGNDVFPPIEESSQNLLLGQAGAQPSLTCEMVVPIEKGEPVIISDLLTSAWKSGGMNHIMGYDQHDAHEFLDSFLDILSKHSVKFRKRVHHSVTKVFKENAVVPELCERVDMMRDVFGGTLRSVLLCETCGVKRIQKEPYMNISLSLSEEIEKMHEGGLNIETCLQHFVLPELLGDLVFCNSCRKRTPTKKQHTFAKFPKILCLHLKRFDAAKNKKIEDFVSFPSHGLNMGVLLSHWCEVTRLGSAASKNGESMPSAEPNILYDLFGTVNHIGNMQSGHYVANVKVDDTWYHCNDQHVSYIQEESVLEADGAYVLFYARR